ncbi:MAG: ABC transporter ATP-binding protein, partial [Pseudomonadota bacterium]|nr:ABC transporter ATP-binding protein [Pseudomonadota bacterium]
LLADRVIMMSNGPRARVGRVMDVNLPRPRSRKALLEHPDYYAYREKLLTFLKEYEDGDPETKASVEDASAEAA